LGEVDWGGGVVIYIFITRTNDSVQTMTIRDLRYDFGKVEACLADGGEIEITRHGRTVARISPPRATGSGQFDAAEHRRRLNRTWGDRVFTAVEVNEMREAERGDFS
jgi:antitoxin (DNA-binding transcriptional repressor) of toxin-antitoxin stability system